MFGALASAHAFQVVALFIEAMSIFYFGGFLTRAFLQHQMCRSLGISSRSTVSSNTAISISDQRGPGFGHGIASQLRLSIACTTVLFTFGEAATRIVVLGVGNRKRDWIIELVGTFVSAHALQVETHLIEAVNLCCLSTWNNKGKGCHKDVGEKFHCWMVCPAVDVLLVLDDESINRFGFCETNAQKFPLHVRTDRPWLVSLVRYISTPKQDRETWTFVPVWLVISKDTYIVDRLLIFWVQIIQSSNSKHNLNGGNNKCRHSYFVW